jgi:hypothetical protein
VHHRDDRGPVGDQGGQRVRIDDAGRVHAEPADVPAAPGQGAGGLQHRFVLDRADDEVTPAGRLECLGGAAQRQDVGFRAAAGEDDFRGVSAHEGRHGGPCRVDPRLGPLAPAVDARGVAEVVPDGGVHGVRHRRIDGRRGVVVEVDGH